MEFILLLIRDLKYRLGYVSTNKSGYTLLRDPRYNKGLAFTEQERDTHYLRGLLPPAVLSQQLQVRIVHQISIPTTLFMLLLTAMHYSIIY